MDKIIVAAACFTMGVSFQKLGLPLPAPPSWYGVLCICLITAGYYAAGGK